MEAQASVRVRRGLALRPRLLPRGRVTVGVTGGWSPCPSGGYRGSRSGRGADQPELRLPGTMGSRPRLVALNFDPRLAVGSLLGPGEAGEGPVL